MTIVRNVIFVAAAIVLAAAVSYLLNRLGY